MSSSLSPSTTWPEVLEALTRAARAEAADGGGMMLRALLAPGAGASLEERIQVHEDRSVC